jgi:hypothetical protein
MNIKSIEYQSPCKIKNSRHARVTCRFIKHFLLVTTVVNESSPTALEASLGHPNPDAGIDTSHSAQLVKHFIHALQPDPLSARTITLEHLLDAQRTTMG